MTKKSFENLLSKWNVLVIAMVALMSVGLTSCTGDDDDPEPVPEPPSPTQVSVKNNGTYTLSRFRIIFLNSSREKLSEKDCATLAPGDIASAKIPTAANEYYMATYLASTWFFSPYYSITYTSLSLSDAEIGEWKTN